MKSATIKLKSIARAGAFYSPDRARLLSVALASLAMLAVIYVLILGNMIRDIAERKALDAEANILAGEVRALEESYLDSLSRVDADYSRNMGFKEIKATYAERPSLGSADTGGNEI